VRHLTFAALISLAAAGAEAGNRYLFAQPNASAPPTIAFASQEVRIAPVRAGARIVLFFASLRGSGGILRQNSRAEILVDDDRDGLIVYRPAGGIPHRSLWIAIDLDTGERGFVSPSPALNRLLRHSPSLFKRDAEGVLGVYDREQLSADMVIVRPGEGAWRVRAHEGGSGDADRSRNGKLSLASADALAVAGKAPPPRKLRKGDVIALIDPDRLEALIVEVDR
jgi:hypothetical protein